MAIKLNNGIVIGNPYGTGQGFIPQQQVTPEENKNLVNPPVNSIPSNETFNLTTNVQKNQPSAFDSVNLTGSIASGVESYSLLSLDPPEAQTPTGNIGSGDTKKEVKGLTKQEADAIASKNSDPTKEKSIGGSSSDVSINILEVGKSANLNKNDLIALSTYVSGPANLNLLAAWVYVLYNGSGAVNKTVRMENNPNKNDQPINISGNMLMYIWTKGNSIIKGYFHKGITKIFKKTPAFKQKFFEDIGEVGTTLLANTERVPSNPMSGSAKHNPSLVERMLNKIHPKFTEELEKYVNVLKGKIYLALPANILGSIQYAINYINGIITAFTQIINEIYQGCLNAIREFVAAIDSIMGAIMQWGLSLLDQIIPLEFLCLLLDILSIFVGDITMYTNLFSHSAKISDVLGLFNIEIPFVSDFLEDPINALKGLLPEDVQNVIDIVNNVANDPMGYLGSVLNDYGYGYMMNYLQGDIMGGVLKQFGGQAPILYPISGIMKKYGFSGKVQLTDPNQPSPNVVLPPILKEIRQGVEKTFDSLGRSAEFIDNIKEESYKIPPSNDLFGIRRV